MRWARGDRHPILSAQAAGTAQNPTNVNVTTTATKFYGVVCTGPSGVITIKDGTGAGGTAIMALAIVAAPIMNEVPAGNYIVCNSGLGLSISGSAAYDYTIFYELGDTA